MTGCTQLVRLAITAGDMDYNVLVDCVKSVLRFFYLTLNDSQSLIFVTSTAMYLLHGLLLRTERQWRNRHIVSLRHRKWCL